MKLKFNYLFFIVCVSLMTSCISSSTTKIETLNNPDKEITKQFGIDNNDEILYQFYEKYGFTDIEEHLILIVKTNKINKLIPELPIDSIEFKKMKKIDSRKFTKNKIIDFKSDKNINQDIRIESKVFDKGIKNLLIEYNGKCAIISNDSLETIFIMDRKNNLLYFESKKFKP